MKADLPGLQKADVKVEVGPEGLTITGERKEEGRKRRRGTSRDRAVCRIRCERFVPLPDAAELDKAVANSKDGVLEVKVPLAATPKPQAKTIDDR